VTTIPIPPLALIPLDDRPCNRLFPAQLAEIVALELVTPPRDLLGWFTTPGDCKALACWLQACPAQHAVVSLDMLCYGGLIAARSDAVDAPTALARLHALRELKHQRPDLSLLASCCLPRLGVTVSSADALARHQDLVEYSVLVDRLERLGDEEARPALAQVQARLDPQVIASYLEVRRRSHEIAQQALRLVSEGVFAFLILAQEDAAPCGLHVREQEALQATVEQLGITQRVALHPGADETGMVLMARHCAAAADRPLRICADYATDAGSQVIPRYEDRPLRDTVASQIRAAGAEASPPGKADAMLFIHTPVGEQTEAGDAPPQGQAPFVALQADSVAERVRFAGLSGAVVGVADLLYANGGDPELFAALERASGGRHLRAYAAWNTAANTLGTVISQLCLEVLASASGRAAGDASRRFLACRVADDYCYQTHVRSRAVERARTVGADQFALGAAWEAVEEYVRAELPPLAASTWSRLMDVAWADLGWEFAVSLPWHRAFEVEVAVQPAPAP
jgi:hypothetical protein